MGTLQLAVISRNKSGIIDWVSDFLRTLLASLTIDGFLGRLLATQFFFRVRRNLVFLLVLPCWDSQKELFGGVQAQKCTCWVEKVVFPGRFRIKMCDGKFHNCGSSFCNITCSNMWRIVIGLQLTCDGFRTDKNRGAIQFCVFRSKNTTFTTVDFRAVGNRRQKLHQLEDCTAYFRVEVNSENNTWCRCGIWNKLKFQWTFFCNRLLLAFPDSRLFKTPKSFLIVEGSPKEITIPSCLPEIDWFIG